MRLAIVSSHPIQYYSPLYRELAKHLDVRVFFAHRATPAQQAAAGFGQAFDWDVDLLSGFDNTLLRNVARQPSAAHFSGCDTPGVGAALADGAFDAVLVTGWHLKTYWQAVWAAKRLGIPVLVRGDSQLQTQRSLAKRTTKALVYPMMLRQFDGILYTGQKNRRYLEHYGYASDRLFFSPHCVDQAWFAERSGTDPGVAIRRIAGIPIGAKVCLFAGKLQSFKRPLDVVDACGKLGRQGREFQVLVAGSGEQESAMSARADAAGVRLHVLGFCNQSQMPAVYAAADVLALPSDARETWGLVANEALACETPVVISDQVGSAEDLGRGFHVVSTSRAGDTDDLAAKLAQMVDRRLGPLDFVPVNRRYSLASAAAGVIDAVEAVRSRRGALSAMTPSSSLPEGSER